MKMLMVVCPKGRRAALRELIAKHDVHAYSEIGNVVGEGTTGKRMGSETWPETSDLIFTVADDSKTTELMDALREFKKSLFPSEGIKAFVMPVEQQL